MTIDIMTNESEVDHFLISTYENQLLFIFIDKPLANNKILEFGANILQRLEIDSCI